MEDPYPIPAGREQVELVVQRSRFIAAADAVPTVEAARAFVAEIRAQFPDATHHVYAFAVGFGASVTHGMSDAGEPPGTAGRPVLAVVRGSGLGDLAVVVTRYYGGTKLGTGGLVRAYTDVTQLVLEALPRTWKVERRAVSARLPYGFYETFRRLVDTWEGEIRGEDHAADVVVRVRLRADRVDGFRAAVGDASAGGVGVVEEEAMDEG